MKAVSASLRLENSPIQGIMHTLPSRKSMRRQLIIAANWLSVFCRMRERI